MILFCCIATKIRYTSLDRYSSVTYMSMVLLSSMLLNLRFMYPHFWTENTDLRRAMRLTIGKRETSSVLIAFYCANIMRKNLKKLKL